MLCNALFAQRNEAKKGPHECQMRFDYVQASQLGYLRLSSHLPACRLLVKKAHRAFYLHLPLWTPAPVFLNFYLWRKIIHKTARRSQSELVEDFGLANANGSTRHHDSALYMEWFIYLIDQLWTRAIHCFSIFKNRLGYYYLSLVLNNERSLVIYSQWQQSKSVKGIF